MSNIPLSNIERLLERTIYEALRVETVDKGYLPDITTYTQDQAGYDSFRSDLQTIISTKGFAIEVFGHGSNLSRGLKRSPRMVIESQMFIPGQLGGDSQRFYIDKGTDYDAYKRPPQTANFFFNIHLIGTKATHIRTMQAIQAIAIPRRGYVSLHDPDNEFVDPQNIFVRNIAFVDLGNYDEGILEKLYRYEIPDVFEMDDELLETVGKMDEITLEIKDNEDNDLGETVIN